MKMNTWYKFKNEDHEQEFLEAPDLSSNKRIHEKLTSGIDKKFKVACIDKSNRVTAITLITDEGERVYDSKSIAPEQNLGAILLISEYKHFIAVEEVKEVKVEREEFVICILSGSTWTLWNNGMLFTKSRAVNIAESRLKANPALEIILMKPMHKVEMTLNPTLTVSDL